LLSRNIPPHLFRLEGGRTGANEAKARIGLVSARAHIRRNLDGQCFVTGTSQQRLTVAQLEERWRYQQAAAPGTVFYGLSISQMPPWDEICSSLNWEFHLPDDGHFTTKHHGYFGVYRLIALASECDLMKPATLNRVAGLDASGTLYLGETGNLARRLNELQRSGWGHRYEDSHGAIGMLKQIGCLDFFPSKLGIALLFTTVGDTRGVERDLIRAYMNSFGDTPPLNYKL
jgi:hypothetical protein